ncbi:hypothetical protein FVR03_07215 [Pontibacter qinzhouensis]|uniref:Uncharacterized protein n=1 Tax=Pontibacter qinzhouensis TaxID=2603253 RepID=A0A5C8KAQ3_9BACT|nr:hypothetical protein [Pontibacter qinzhouensis]TXK48999.1 hypothetical protein FVR03_07215 [Pontibacter qinzhouensis]
MKSGAEATEPVIDSDSTSWKKSFTKNTKEKKSYVLSRDTCILFPGEIQIQFPISYDAVYSACFLIVNLKKIKRL